MTSPESLLPPGVFVLERGWLSSNTVVVRGEAAAAVIDSGYCTHSAQTLALVAHSAGALPVTDLVNTHLHSDHCGGNAALQSQYPELCTWIPSGLAEAVRSWDSTVLTYEPTGQSCPRFRFDRLLEAGSDVILGDLAWQVHAAPGHDPHSVVLFEPVSRTLLSADALWENGFGVVFPEIEGEAAFDDVGATLELIERIGPAVVVPGHGRPFATVGEALHRARSRLAAYTADPRRHAGHAAKVLLKFKLLELQKVRTDDLLRWVSATPYFGLVHARWFADATVQEWFFTLLAELERAGAVTCDTDFVANA